MAWNIIQHAFFIVFGNLKEALKASILPFIILVGIVMAFSALSGLPIVGEQLNVEAVDNLGSIGLFVILGLVSVMFVFGWVAVTWHRFILLEEYPTIIPSVSGRPIWPYVGRILMIILQMMVVVLPVMLILLPSLGGLLASPVLVVGASLALNVFITFLWFRVCVSLPSVAVGNHMSSVEAWSKTNNIWGDILVMSIIVIVLSFGVNLIVSTLFSSIPIIAGILQFVVQWTSMMVGISILTTVYGHVVEGRPLTRA